MTMETPVDFISEVINHGHRTTNSNAPIIIPVNNRDSSSPPSATDATGAATFQALLTIFSRPSWQPGSSTLAQESNRATVAAAGEVVWP